MFKNLLDTEPWKLKHKVFGLKNAMPCIGDWWVERSENTLFWKLQKAHMVYGPRHNTDFRTIDEIIIGWISFCEIRKTVFTESVNYNTPRFQVIYLMNGIFVSIVTVSAVTLFRIIWNRSKCSPWGLLGTHRGPKRVHLTKNRAIWPKLTCGPYDALEGSKWPWNTSHIYNT